jgi:bis(5'-nucleosyl)-tetraphosphatase (symmetrical)
MPDYIIGDVQGCYESLIKLLSKIQFSKDKDRLFFLGDVVNRGADSLRTLRFIKSLDENAEMVLGNHDFHLMACALSSKKPNIKDTFSDILESKYKHELIDFLLSKPLIINHNEATLVHAGIPPNWDENLALSQSLKVQDNLQRSDVGGFIVEMYRNEPTTWKNNLNETDDCRYTINALLRMRFCKDDGSLEFEHKANYDKAPSNYKAWFLHNNRLLNRRDIFFGHWSTLRGVSVPHIYPLDHGCVWGENLRAIRLTDKKIFSIDCPK